MIIFLQYSLWASIGYHVTGLVLWLVYRDGQKYLFSKFYWTIWFYLIGGVACGRVIRYFLGY